VLNDQLTAGNGGAPIGLFWSDPLGGSGNDYDLYILDAGLTVVVNAATNVQDGNDDPVELSTISPGAAAFRYLQEDRRGDSRSALEPLSAADWRTVHRSKTWSFRSRRCLQRGGYACGGANRLPSESPPVHFLGPFNSGNVSELFSSDGPRRVFFNSNGTAVTPALLIWHKRRSRATKAGHHCADGTASAVPGFNPFFGTSAAAPHAAAIAALLKSAGSFTPAQIRNSTDFVGNRHRSCRQRSRHRCRNYHGLPGTASHWRYTSGQYRERRDHAG